MAPLLARVRRRSVDQRPITPRSAGVQRVRDV
jgi:hypothetical protein